MKNDRMLITSPSFYAQILYFNVRLLVLERNIILSEGEFLTGYFDVSRFIKTFQNEKLHFSNVFNRRGTQSGIV